MLGTVFSILINITSPFEKLYFAEAASDATTGIVTAPAISPRATLELQHASVGNFNSYMFNQVAVFLKTKHSSIQDRK